MSWDQIEWGAPQWLIPAAVIAVAFVGLILWAYRRPDQEVGVGRFASWPKIVAIVILTLCLLEPLFSTMRARPGANVLAILVDNSRSMQVANRGLPTGDELRKWLGTSNEGWRARLKQDFDVRLYAVDRGLRKIDDRDSLDWQGEQSNLLRSLTTLRQRLGNRPVAGVLLVTDGNSTERALEWDAEAFDNFPIFPVVPRVPRIPPDVRLADVSVTQTHFESSPTTVAANVIAHGLAGRQLDVQLMDPQGDVVQSQTVTAGEDGNGTAVRFRFRPRQPGISFYQLKALPSKSKLLPITDAIEENNTRTVTIDRGGGPFRILYVAGRPNWEFKFVRRALDRDEELQLVGLIRIADKEPKFRFQDRSGTDANPLFDGFDQKDEEESESYDEAVFVRIGVANSQELAGGFPTTEEDLYRYEGIIIDDLEADFFTADQMLLLRRYVSQRGGSLLMLGGLATFAHGGYTKTPLGDMLPVYLGGVDVESTRPDSMRLSLTRDGMLEPWVRLRATEAEEQQRITRLVPFQTLSQVGPVKPGAICLATVGDSKSNRPAVVTQRYGRGRVGGILVGDLWRSSMHRATTEPDDLATYWRQAGRWLVSDAPRRVEMDVDIAPDGKPAVHIRVTVLDPEFQPDDEATVNLTVTPPDGEPIRMVADSSDQAGVFESSYWPHASGGHLLTASVQSRDGQALPTAESGWVWAPEETEFERLAINHTWLRKLAVDSSGEVISPDDISQFVSRLDRRSAPVMERWVTPFWHQPWVFAGVLACLCTEWGIRRWKGLA